MITMFLLNHLKESNLSLDMKSDLSLENMKLDFTLENMKSDFTLRLFRDRNKDPRVYNTPLCDKILH